MKRTHGDPRRDYAKEWKSWRKSKGWTQAQLASALGLDVRTAGRIERGQSVPSASSREAMKVLMGRHYSLLKKISLRDAVGMGFSIPEDSEIDHIEIYYEV